MISTPFSYSGLHLPCFTTCVTASLSEPARAGDRYRMSGRRPSVADIPFKGNWASGDNVCHFGS